MQAEAPAFMRHVARPLERAGRQLRLLASLQPQLCADLALRLAASAAEERTAAAAVAVSDPWAGAAAGADAPYPTPFMAHALHQVRIGSPGFVSVAAAACSRLGLSFLTAMQPSAACPRAAATVALLARPTSQA